MPELAWIIPVTRNEDGEIDNTLPTAPGLPDRPSQGLPPIQLPPLPPGVIAPPIVLPPHGARPENPIYIPETPDHTLPVPPGTIWPPLNPGDGVGGKALLLVFVIGADGNRHGGKFKWIVVDVPPIGSTLPIPPPTATPKI